MTRELRARLSDLNEIDAAIGHLDACCDDDAGRIRDSLMRLKRDLAAEWNNRADDDEQVHECACGSYSTHEKCDRCDKLDTAAVSFINSLSLEEKLVASTAVAQYRRAS